MKQSNNDELNGQEIADNDEHLKKLIKDLLLLKKVGFNQERPLMKMNSNLSRKERILLSLIQELQYMKRHNKIWKSHYEFLHDQTQSSTINRNEIKIYCELQQSEMKEFVERITKYESAISQLKKDKEINIRTNEAVIKTKMIERLQLEEELNKITSKVDNQISTLNGLKIKREGLEKTYGEDKDNFEKTIENQQDKYDALLNQYKFLLATGSYLNGCESKKHLEIIGEVEKKREEDNQREEINMYYKLFNCLTCTVYFGIKRF